VTTADWALIISLRSFLLSLFGFIWNVWSKFIYPQPKVRISAGVHLTVSPTFTSPRYVSARITNYGPGEVTITHAVGRMRSGIFKPDLHFLWKLASSPEPWNADLPQFDAFGFGMLPHKLAVGEQLSVNAHIGNEAFDPTASRIGFSDSFGRTHWLRRRELKNLLTAVAKERTKQGLPPASRSVRPPRNEDSET
jgi:hypothetical protein